MAVEAAKKRVNVPTNEDLAKRNEECTRTVKRLIKNIEMEKKKNKENLDKMAQDAEQQLKEATAQCEQEKADLIAKNEQVEQELQTYMDKCQNISVKTEDDDKVVKDLQLRLNEKTTELEKRRICCAEVDDERNMLKANNLRMEVLMREHQEATQNYRLVVEAEVNDLRCRLRRAEEKNLQMLQRNLCDVYTQPPQRFIMPPAVMPNYCDRLCWPEPQRPLYVRTMAKPKPEIPRKAAAAPAPAPAPAPVESPEDEQAAQDAAAAAEEQAEEEEEEYYASGMKEHPGVFRPFFSQNRLPIRRRRPASRNYPREVICLVLSAVLFALSYFVRTMDTGCRYHTLPYSPPE